MCDCGNECDVSTQDLIRGHTKSCGCLQKEIASKIGKKTISIAKSVQMQRADLTGQKFGKLTVIKRSNKRRSSGLPLWECLCDCGNVTYVTSSDLKSGNTSSCGCTKSKGEDKISKLLRDNHISFINQKTFPNALYKATSYHMIFDFWVKESYLIEYDGIQHFKEVPFFNLTLAEQQARDLEKNIWCKENHIPLIRIPYYYFNNISLEDIDILTSKFII